MVALKEIVETVERPEAVRAGKLYRQIGVRLWGGGAYERESVDGGQTKYQTLSRVETDDIIVNKIWARNGSVAVVTEALAGCYGSGEFPTFSPDYTKLEPRWFHWLTKTKGFWEQCDEKSQGTSGKNRIRPEQFLKVIIPLPPLEEQRRIVAHIEELAAKIEEARGLRRETAEETENILKEAEFQIWPDSSLDNAVPLENVTTYLSRGRQSAQGDSAHYLIKTQHVQQGHYMKSLITLEPHTAMKVLPDAIVQPGDILIACSAAGCLGRVARFMETNQVASTDTHVAIARANSNLILPEYLYLYLEGSQGQIQLRSRERGDWKREKVGFRLTELNLADLKRVPVPLPSLPEQRRIVAYLDDLQARVDAVRQWQAETRAELDGLLPSILDKAFQGELV
jgi:type I restriction enzyme S subunit